MELKHLIVSLLALFMCFGYGQKSENAAPVKTTSLDTKEDCKNKNEIGYCEIFAKACKNGGSCVSKQSGCSGVCVCVEGFSGPHCENVTKSASKPVPKYSVPIKKDNFQRKSVLMQLFRALRFTGTSHGGRMEQNKFSNNLNQHSSTSVLDKSKPESANVDTPSEKPGVNKKENNLGSETAKNTATNTADQSRSEPKKVTNTVSVKDQTTVKIEKTTTKVTTVATTKTATTTEKIKTTVSVKEKDLHTTGSKESGSLIITENTMTDLVTTKTPPSSTNEGSKHSTTKVIIDEVHKNKSENKNKNVVNDQGKLPDGLITSSETSTEVKQQSKISQKLDNDLKTTTPGQIKTESITDKSTPISNYVTSTSVSVDVPKSTSPLASDKTSTATTTDTVALPHVDTVGKKQPNQDQNKAESELQKPEIIPKKENKENYLAGDQFDPNFKSDKFSDTHRVSVSFENNAKSNDVSSHTTPAMPLDTSTSAIISTSTIKVPSQHDTSTSSNAAAKSYSITSGKFQKSDETDVDSSSTDKKTVNNKQSSTKVNPTPLSDQTQSTEGMPDTSKGEVLTTTHPNPKQDTDVSGTLIDDSKKQADTKILPKIDEKITGHSIDNGSADLELEKTGEQSNIADGQNGKADTKSQEDILTVSLDTTTTQLSQKEQTVPRKVKSEEKSKARDLFDSLAKEFSNIVSSVLRDSTTTKVPEVLVTTAINGDNIDINNGIGRQSVSGPILDLSSPDRNGNVMQLTANSVDDKYDKTVTNQINEKSEQITADERITPQHTNIELPPTTNLPISNLEDPKTYKTNDHLAKDVSVSGNENILSTTESGPINSAATQTMLLEEGSTDKKLEKDHHFTTPLTSDVSSTTNPKPIPQDRINDLVSNDKLKLGNMGSDTTTTILNENMITNEIKVTESTPSRGDFLNEIVTGSDNMNSDTLKSEKIQNRNNNIQDTITGYTTPKAAIKALSTTVENLDILKTTAVASPISTVASVESQDELLLPNAEG